MDGFDSKDFYGHSLSEDPKLRTTTRNYEFKYNSSDHLEMVISRVKLDREKKKQKELLSHSCLMPCLAKMRRSKQDQSQIIRPASVDTQVGRINSQNTVVKVMSDAEIEDMISQAILSTADMPETPETSEADISLREIASTYPESESDNSPSTPKLDLVETKVPICTLEILPAVPPQWVEITPTEVANSSIYDIPTRSNSIVSSEWQNTSGINLASDNLEDIGTPTEDKPKEDILSDALSYNSNLSDDVIIRCEESNNQKECESPPDSPMSFGIESPLNDCERAEMERVLGNVLPHLPEIVLDNLDSQEEQSEYSYYQNERNTDGEEDETAEYGGSSSENAELHVQPIVHIQNFDRVPHVNQSPIESIRPSSPKIRNSLKPTSRSPKMSPNISTKSSLQANLDSKMRKQIEVLKHEKIRIFSKMTSIQEKIIVVMDRLRLSLLELSLPDGHVERKLRERNAFEFSVRFSRNYLFPLGRMIEELRNSPKEDYRSAITNEPCVKVCGIYGLLNQALECYHKQIRHFFNDSVPKKLDLLLHMITDTTRVCLIKKIFDKRDTLIQCLLLRCGIFLDFVMQFAEQKRSAREEEIPLRSGRKDPLRLSKTSSKWDLTMNLNNLNMYEPKLVSKKPKKKIQKKIIPVPPPKQRESKSKNAKPIISKSYEPVAMPAPDPVDTQVRQVNNAESMQLINFAIEEQPDNELTKTVIEALQDITKDEVRQMLEPIVLNLDSILRSPVSYER